uniref:nucleosome-remodeling factor subunit BPTF isoform X2 n=1 Tax=Myxine glutinosa TaxID=7769 RepID=UPI00358E9432
MKGRRGRPPKPLALGLGEASVSAGGAGELKARGHRGRSLPPRGSAAQARKSTRTGRVAALRSKKLISKVAGVRDSSGEDEEEIEEDDEDDETLGDYDSDYQRDMDYIDVLDEAIDEQRSYDSDSSFRSHASSTTSRKRPFRAPRPLTPPYEEDVPPLVLPSTSEDFLMPKDHLLEALGIYEVLRRFRTPLRLSPFRFEDFCAALSGQEQSALITETHLALLRAVLKEEDSSGTTFGPTDLKDSINSMLYLLDVMTWPEVMRAYCESDQRELGQPLASLQEEDFPYTPGVEAKLRVLRFLTDQFLASTPSREELTSEGTIQYDDHCRACHRLGDLLCCETCPAVYHLECVRPPLAEVPEDEWQCEVCTAHCVPGVTDCLSEVETSMPYVRHEPLGYDRHRRKFWFLCRRIIVEDDGEDGGDRQLWYYSTRAQLAELMEVLDSTRWEAELCRALDESREELHRHMDVTEQLSDKARGSNRSYLTSVNEEIMEKQKAKHEAEMEQLKQRLAEVSQRMSEQGEQWEDKSALMEGDEVGEVVEVTTEESVEEQGVDLAQLDGNVSTQDNVHASEQGVKVNDKIEASEEVSRTIHPCEVQRPEVAVQQASQPTSGIRTLEVALDLPDNVSDVSSQHGGESCSSVKSEKACLEDGLADQGTNSNTASESGKTQTPQPTRMLTRLRNPESKLSQLKSAQAAAAVHEANKTYKEGKEVLVVGATGEICRLNVRKDLVLKAGPMPSLFKLGQEGKHRVYQNQYTCNVLALNKHQHREENDKRRYLSHKFSLGPPPVTGPAAMASSSAVSTAATPGEFRWGGAVHGSKALNISTLRLTIIQLENNIPAPFLHPNWAAHRTNWIKAVQMCNKPREFALALAILECAIKPVVMLPVWKESLGHTRLRRITATEKEEKEKSKKRERRQEEEEVLQQATWVKYTIPVKHQVWKQKGEEYRITGYGGWMWVGRTRISRFLPRFPGSTNPNYRLADKSSTEAMKHERCASSDGKVESLEPQQKQTSDAETKTSVLLEKGEPNKQLMNMDVRSQGNASQESVYGPSLPVNDEIDVDVEESEAEPIVEMKQEPGERTPRDGEALDSRTCAVESKALLIPVKQEPPDNLEGFVDQTDKLEPLKQETIHQEDISLSQQEESQNSNGVKGKIKCEVVSEDDVEIMEEEVKKNDGEGEESEVNVDSVARDSEADHDGSRRVDIDEDEEESSSMRSGPSSVDGEQRWGEDEALAALGKFDVIDVCMGFLSRTWYPKMVKASRLDSLLERRQKQFILEERQRLQALPRTCLGTASFRAACTPSLKDAKRQWDRSTNAGKVVTRDLASEIRRSQSTKNGSRVGFDKTGSKNNTMCAEVGIVQAGLSKERCLKSSNAKETIVKDEDSVTVEEKKTTCKPEAEGIGLRIEAKLYKTSDSIADGKWTRDDLMQFEDNRMEPLNGTRKAKDVGDEQLNKKVPATILGTEDEIWHAENTNNRTTSIGPAIVTNAENGGDQENDCLGGMVNGDVESKRIVNITAAKGLHLALPVMQESRKEHEDGLPLNHVSKPDDSSNGSCMLLSEERAEQNVRIHRGHVQQVSSTSNFTHPKLPTVTAGISEDGLSDEDSTHVVPVNSFSGAVPNSALSIRHPAIVTSVSRVSSSSANNYSSPAASPLGTSVIDFTAASCTSSMKPEADSTVNSLSPLVMAAETAVARNTANLASVIIKPARAPTVVTEHETFATMSSVSEATPVLTSSQSSTTSCVASAFVTVTTSITTNKMSTCQMGGATVTTASILSSMAFKTTTTTTATSETLTRQACFTSKKVKLLKFARPKKARSGTALPSYRKFLTRSGRKSIFVLPAEELRRLARHAGAREVQGFSYLAKQAWDVWPFPSPRPTFAISWRYRLQTVRSLSAASLMLRLLWACLRWEDMLVKPPAGASTTRTETTDTEITTTEIIKRRDVGYYGLRSEYCIRKIVCPIDVPETNKEPPTPQRKGLRSSALRPKKVEGPRQTEPVVLETWVPEEELEPWEIRAFAERVEKEKVAAAQEQAKANEQRKAEEFKAQLEVQLKSQRLAAQQKRLQQADGQKVVVTGSGVLASGTQTVVVGTTVGQSLVAGTKLVISKVSASPSANPISFQAGRNFQQSFATWIGKATVAQTVTSSAAVAVSAANATLQLAGSPITVGKQLMTTKLPLPTNSKIVTLNVPSSQTGVVQQKVLSILPAAGSPGQPTIATYQPRTATITIRQGTPGAVQQVLTTGGTATLRPGVTLIRAPVQQQSTSLGKTIIRTPLIVQQGQTQQVVTQIIRGQPVSTAVTGGAGSGLSKVLSAAVSAASAQGTTGPAHVTATPQTSRIVGTVVPPPATAQQQPQASLPGSKPQQSQVRLTASQISQLTQGQSTGQGLKVIVQGQGQTQGQLQLIPRGVTIIPGPGQQLMQAAMPDGTIQRFLFTPGSTPAIIEQSSVVASTSTAALPSQPKVQPASQPATVLSQPSTPQQPSTQILSNSGQEVSTGTSAVAPAQPCATTLSTTSLLSSPQKVQVQTSPVLPSVTTPTPTTTASAQSVQNVVSVQAPSVQEQLQRIQQMQVQRHMQQQQRRLAMEARKAAETPPAPPSTQAEIQKQVVQKQSAVIEQLKAKTRATSPTEREEAQRLLVCNQVLKSLLDRIDRDERQAQKKRKREESVEQKRSKVASGRLAGLLFKHKEQLKSEILKKRALLEKDLQAEVQEELKQDLKRLKKERVSMATMPGIGQKRRREPELRDQGSRTKHKKMINTATRDSKRDNKLYCICKTTYDPSRFYIGCDLCTNWFHGDCVGVTDRDAEAMDEYVCDECRHAQEGSSEELYCICQTPYDESQFYIGCDHCQNWFHGRCVGVLQSEAEFIDEYICPNCQSAADVMTALSPLSERDYENLRRILRSMQLHKMAWPFLEPVDEDEAPGYYDVIKEPMDLSTIERRLATRTYTKLAEFVGDITKMFDNCRYYNPPESTFVKCAEVLETSFVQKLKAFKANSWDCKSTSSSDQTQRFSGLPVDMPRAKSIIVAPPQDN